jgi:hypothetical protein
LAVLSTRIEYAADQPPSFLARWASRIAWFAMLLFVMSLFLHRVLSLPTPMAINLAFTAFALAVAVLCMSAIAGLDIWVTGRQGAARVVMAVFVSLAMLAVPFAVWIESRKYPMIADVTTDTKSPPEFDTLMAARSDAANPAAYNVENAQLQQKGYPDIRTLVVPRSADDTFDVVLQALTKLKLKPVSELAPAEAPSGAGTIELSDRTLVLGFRDDVVIRVAGDETSARVDVRSASRFGRNDFGHNAARVRMILKEIVGRLEATLPQVKPALSPEKDKRAVKRPRATDRPSAGQRPRPDPSRPAVRRGPEQSAAPPE